MMRQKILTGDRPTGKLHLGHYIGSLQSRVQLQDCYDQYIMIADLQALTDHFDDTETIAQHRVELAKDYLSIGIDPHKTTILIQSQIPEIIELTLYYMNLVTLGRLKRNPTVKYEMQQKGYRERVPVGFLCYPLLQASDITIFQGDLVPVGADQLPIIEQTNELVKCFNRTYHTDVLKPCKAFLTKVPRLVGIDGHAKASKSLGNAIFLSDEPEIIKQKVFQMYTDPNHIKVSDPGCTEGNVVFTYLDAFHSDKEAVAALKKQYSKGGLGDVTIKHMLNECLQLLLEPIRAKRADLDTAWIKEVLYHGSKKARHLAKETLEEVRMAMGLKLV